MNVLFQIPGLGQEKCLAIVQKYSNYESLLYDFMGNQDLSELQVRRGLKEMRLGEPIANRIYKSLFSTNFEENIMEKRLWRMNKNQDNLLVWWTNKLIFCIIYYFYIKNLGILLSLFIPPAFTKILLLSTFPTKN